jgi:RNA polymerase sigma-70 factor (ECF subfamily)
VRRGGVRFAAAVRDWGVVIAVSASVNAEERYATAYEALWSDVFRFALSWTNDWAAAEDLAQEAFARLWREGDRVDWADDVLPWLIVTTRRLAQDRFRRLRRQLTTGGEARLTTLGEAVTDRWLDLRDAMAVLLPLERAALVMTAVDGRTYEEAAELMGTTAGALRAAASRARRKLEDAR